MRSFLIAVLLATPVTSFAQPSKPTDVTKMASDDCERARKAGKTCVLSIEDGDTVEGKTPTAGDPPLGGRGFGTAASLIEIRRHFIPEIMKSAEDID